MRMSANFTGSAWNAIWRAQLGYRDNLSFFLVHCLLKFVVDLTGTSVVSVYSRMPLLSPIECDRLMKFGITFAHGDYSRGYEPVYMNDFRFYTDVYLISVKDVVELEQFMKQLYAAQLILNPDRQTFIFLLPKTETDGRNATLFEQFFRQASAYIFEFIVIVEDRFRADGMQHLTEHQRLIHMLKENYFGYYYWNSCLVHPRRITARTVEFQSKVHLREYFGNGHLCPPKADKIRVRLSVWEPFVDEDSPAGSLNFTAGLDIQLITSIARQLNVSLEFTTSPNGWSDDFQNASTVNNWKALQVQDVDLVLSSTITTRQRSKYFYPTAAYFHDSDGFCVPVAGRIPQYRKWFEVFDIFVALFGMYAIFVPVSYYFGRKYNPTESVGNVALYCYAVLCNLASPRVLRGERVRWLFMCWCVYCFLLNIYYQSKLISILYKPSYEHQVSDQVDLVNSKYHLLFLSIYERYFEGPYDPNTENIQYQIQQRMETCANTDICLYNVTFSRNSAMCIQKTYLEYRMGRYLDQNRAPLIYCFKDPINLSSILFHVNRNFPLITVLDRLIMNVKESGVIFKWLEDIFCQSVEGYKKNTSSGSSYKPLELGMLRVWFYFYLIGIGIAIAGFIAEQVYYKFRIKHRVSGIKNKSML